MMFKSTNIYKRKKKRKLKYNNVARSHSLYPEKPGQHVSLNISIECLEYYGYQEVHDLLTWEKQIDGHIKMEGLIKVQTEGSKVDQVFME